MNVRRNLNEQSNWMKSRSENWKQRRKTPGKLKVEGESSENCLFWFSDCYRFENLSTGLASCSANFPHTHLACAIKLLVLLLWWPDGGILRDFFFTEKPLKCKCFGDENWNQIAQSVSHNINQSHQQQSFNSWNCSSIRGKPRHGEGITFPTGWKCGKIDFNVSDWYDLRTS